MRIALLTLLALLSSGGFPLGQAPEHLSKARQMFSELQDEKTAAQAATQLREMAKADPDVQQFVSDQLMSSRNTPSGLLGSTQLYWQVISGSLVPYPLS